VVMLTKSVNIHEAKTHLSQLLQFVQEGNTVTICNSGDPVAELRFLKKNILKKRKLGLLEGKFTVPDDFDETPEDLLAYFK
jgi:antitoxin (DNA-binding transcriptional repressor) of toxin-antitoxin stability system